MAPPGTATRPTPDRVREAVFNALWSRDVLDGAVVLDLYAGSGAMGIEALSRGAARVAFVEHDRRARDAIMANLATCGLEARAEVIPDDADRFLDHALAEGQRFDIAICDPPYAFDAWERLLDRLRANLVVVESRDRIAVPSGWALTRDATYGSTWVGFVEPVAQESA